MRGTGVLRCAARKPRAVLVAGARTPFCKAFGKLLKVDSIGLGTAAVDGLLQKTSLDPNVVDELIWGNVVLQTSAPNVAREIVIDLNLPRTIVGHSVSMACASSLKAILEANTLINDGHADCIIAGGSDSMSSAEFPIPRNVGHGLAMFQFGPKSIGGKLSKFKQHAGLNPAGWLPKPPAVAERSTGKTMGYHADLMAELNEIPRADQETFAMLSHEKALVAQERGYLAEEIAGISLSSDKPPIDQDNMMKTPNPDKIRRLKPSFRRKAPKGSITAATSSDLTDGGSSVLLMSEECAKKHGYPTDIVVRSWSHAAIDPYPQLLLAPALAIPKALKQAGLTLQDIDVFEIHEAFAAQVLATLKVLESPSFCKDVMGLDEPLGPIDHGKLNVNGGSLAIGHPFAATGGRVITAAMNQLRRAEKQYALVSICAAGGLGTVAILERRV